MTLRAGLVVVAMMTATPAFADDREPRLAIGGSAVLWIPQSDADDYADVSLGLRPQVTYWIIPLVGVTGSFDWVFVNEESGIEPVTYYSFSAGARFTMPRPMRVKPYGEILLGWHVLDSALLDESDLGFRFGGGATYALGRSVVASAGLGYSSVSLDAPFGTEFDVTAFVLDVGIAGRF